MYLNRRDSAGGPLPIVALLLARWGSGRNDLTGASRCSGVRSVDLHLLQERCM